MKYFKLGLATVLSIMVALAVIANYADRLNALEGWEKALAVITLASISIIVALPFWLTVITAWHKLHHSSYVAFKNWCIKTSNEVVND